MKTLCIMIVAAAVGACSSSSTGTSRPATCQKTDRSGTYQATYTKQSGTCPDLPSNVVSLNGGTSSNCEIHTDVWSEGDCKNERTLTCVEKVSAPSQYGGYANVTTDVTGVTRQESADGALLSGTWTIRVDSTDGTSCQGTYSISMQRL